MWDRDSWDQLDAQQARADREDRERWERPERPRDPEVRSLPTFDPSVAVAAVVEPLENPERPKVDDATGMRLYLKALRAKYLGGDK